MHKFKSWFIVWKTFSKCLHHQWFSQHSGPNNVKSFWTIEFLLIKKYLKSSKETLPSRSKSILFNVISIRSSRLTILIKGKIIKVVYLNTFISITIILSSSLSRNYQMTKLNNRDCCQVLLDSIWIWIFIPNQTVFHQGHHFFSSDVPITVDIINFKTIFSLFFFWSYHFLKAHFSLHKRIVPFKKTLNPKIHSSLI